MLISLITVRIYINLIEIKLLVMPKGNPENIVPVQSTLNCRGTLLDLSRPVVMGILNVTPDSFSDGGMYNSPEAALHHAGQMLEEGAAILDIGAYSSRPGATDISPAEELERLNSVVPQIREAFPDAILSIDTFRAEVAKAMLEAGAHIINDISGGQADAKMYETVAEFDAPYILMHMQGTPQTMQKNPEYEDVVNDVMEYFNRGIRAARAAGITDIVLDPGFGFGKTLEHNYDLFRNLEQFSLFGLPLLVGISRKSMIYRLFDTVPTDVLELSTALHFRALDAGAKILRVHDVRPAVRAIKLHHYLANGTL